MSIVLIGQAYHLRFDPKLWKAMQPYAPLGALYAASVLRQDGVDVAFHDAMLAGSEAEWETALRRHDPTCAVLFEDNFNYLSKMCLLRMRKAAFRMLDAARQHGCRTVVCSSDATDHPRMYLEAGADVVLLGEGEQSLAEAVRGSREAPGIAFLDGDRMVRTPKRGVIRELDALPFPAWDLIDVDRYRRIWRRHHGYFSMNMVTSRGCPFHCNWCAKPIWGQRYHARSPENVVREMRHLQDRFAPDHIWFMDDMMGIKPGWMRRFAALVEEQQVRIPFKCLNRVDLLLREGEIDALRRAGCRIVWTGVESGSQKILDAMDKGIRIGQIRDAAQRLHEGGIQVGFFLQFGYPGETRDDIRKTFQLVRDCMPDQIGVSVSYPLPGTKFFESVRDQLGPKRQWNDSDDLAMMYRGPFSTAFYRQLHRALHKEHRARKAATELRHAFRCPSSFTPRHVREAGAWLFHTATLPVARFRMHRASRIPHQGLAPVAGNLTPDEAAKPTPQEEVSLP